MEFGVVILAAGASTRMGRPKLVLPWGATSILGHLTSLWQQLGAGQIAAVLAANDPHVSAELDRLKTRSPADNAVCRILNPKPGEGMFSSIQCAARWRGWDQKLTHWAIALGDQPHLRRETLTGLLQLARAHPTQICQPLCAGRPRHPVVLPQTVFALLACSNAKNLREFLASYKLAGFPADDPGLDLDIDRPEDYQKALALAGLASGAAD